MRAKADIVERKLLQDRAKLESQVAELRLKARKEDEFSNAERKKFLVEANKIQDTILNKETEYLSLRRDAQVLENTFSKTNKENKDKEAEAIADRVGVIADGELMLVEDKDTLMARMGQKQLDVLLTDPITDIPAALQSDALELSEDGTTLIYTYDTRSERTGITKLLADVAAAGLVLRDVQTRQSSLEDIFVGLVKEDAA